MRLMLVEAPAAEPLSLADMKLQLRLPAGYTAEDATLGRVIRASRHRVERWTWRRLIDQGVAMVTAGFVGSRGGLLLPTAPISSVVEVAYRDADGAPQVLDPESYYLDGTEGEPMTLRPARGFAWPAVDRESAEPVRVTVRAGWADAAALSAEAEDLVAAVAMLATHLFDNRGQQTVGSTVGRNVVVAEELAAPWRLPVAVSGGGV